MSQDAQMAFPHREGPQRVVGKHVVEKLPHHEEAHKIRVYTGPRKALRV